MHNPNNRSTVVYSQWRHKHAQIVFICLRVCRHFLAFTFRSRSNKSCSFCALRTLVQLGRFGCRRATRPQKLVTLAHLNNRHAGFLATAFKFCYRIVSYTCKGSHIRARSFELVARSRPAEAVPYKTLPGIFASVCCCKTSNYKLAQKKKKKIHGLQCWKLKILGLRMLFD